MKNSFVKVHTRDGIAVYLNANYIVRYSDRLVVVDDWVYNPDCKTPESKHSYEVFETADEINGQIQGTLGQQDLDRKYQEDFLAAKEKRGGIAF